MRSGRHAMCFSLPNLSSHTTLTAICIYLRLRLHLLWTVKPASVVLVYQLNSYG